MIVMGIDIGFAKTGLSVIRLGPVDDELTEATTFSTQDDKVGSAVHRDVVRLRDMHENIVNFIREKEPAALFVEIPGAGAQGARPNRCMAFATALIVLIAKYEDIPFEFFEAREVEQILGIQKKPEKGLSKSERTKMKKQRLTDVVMQEWPLFDAWPARLDEAQDAIDSAAAFLAGRQYNKLYARLKAKVQENER